MRDIKIVLATDHNYAAPTAVAIRSLIANAASGYTYSVYVMHSGLDEKNIHKIESVGAGNVSVQCMNIRDKISAVDGLRSAHLTQETLYRLYIPDIFDVDRIIYMDGDMILCNDIAELYDTDLNGYVMAAAGDVLTSDIAKHYSRFADVQSHTFFNAGLLVINCTEFKRQNIKERCIELLIDDAKRSRPLMTFMDQDALNCVCRDNIKYLDMSWNFQPLVHNDDREYMILTEECRLSYERAVKEPKLIHFTGIRKPWRCPGIFLAEKFFQYEKEVDYHEELLRLQEEYAVTLSMRFPFWNIKRGSRIVIYGLGEHGIKLIKDIVDSGFADIAAITDSKAEVDDSRFCTPDELISKDFDALVIAIENESAAKAVFEKLSAIGIGQEKIIWLFERDCPWN